MVGKWSGGCNEEWFPSPVKWLLIRFESGPDHKNVFGIIKTLLYICSIVNNKKNMEKLRQKLEDKKKQLQEVIEIRKNGVFKNSDIEIIKIENQLIGEIQLLRQFV